MTHPLATPENIAHTARAMKNILLRSIVVWRGASHYNGAPVRAVLVPRSSNRKTGRMVQLHILPDDIAPHTAQACGRDAAVCGMCPLRPALQGGCYVVTCQGPLSTWKATNGAPVAGAGQVAGMLRGATLRLGAYGDPAALPPFLVSYLVRLVGGRATGYTHGWRLRPDLRTTCMASTHSAEDTAEAHAAGWRTFRITRPEAPRLPTEIECPSERVACAQCLLCRGATLQARSIVIEAHGSRVGQALRVVA